MIDSKYRNLEAVIPSPDDERDYWVGQKVDIDNDFPEEYAVWQPPVEDQGQIGNCVAQALANVFECWEHREGKRHKDFSVGYIYGMSDHHGMIPREACGYTVDEGDVYRSIWEAFIENPECHELRMAVSDEIKAKAKHMGEYVRIHSLVELKAFIVKYQLPVMIVAKGEYYSWMASGGLHATAAFGWDKDNNILYTNSWGTGGCFGDGKGKMEFGKIRECWGIIPMEKKEIEFSDIAGHWAEKDIKEAARRGIVNGFADGTFKPNETLTRAQMAAISTRILAEVERMLDERD